MVYKEQLLKNIEVANARVAEILQRCKLDYSINIVGASKCQSKEIVKEIFDNKLIKVLGENRAQELVEKYEKGIGEWHFIGALQSNKVKQIIDKVSLIHSLDSINLAKEIDKQAGALGIVANCLVEINVGKEESKSGVFIEDAYDFIDKLKNFENIKIKGFMAVMPRVQKEETIRLYKLFRKMCLDAKVIRQQNFSLETISAGMSDDYELAIEFGGSNLIRLGTALFGKREELN